MKTKNKTLALVEIAVVLCSVFLVALPVISAEQTTQGVSAITTTASEDDYVLDIYGNANEDDTIDMRDVTYTKLVIFGKKPETELADAYYDDEVDVLDVVQVKLIILGRESELTVVDSADRTVTVRKPVKRMVIANHNIVETGRSLSVDKDRIVGVGETTIKRDIFFPEYSDCPDVGSSYHPDIEKVLSLHPDVVFLRAYRSIDLDKAQEDIEDAGITVLRFACYRPETYVEETEKLGYIFGKREEAAEFLEFYEGFLNTIEERVEEIPDEKRPKVYFEYKTYKTVGEGAGYHQKLEMAGGNNIFGDLSGYFYVDKEEVIRLDPEIIVRDVGYGITAGYSTDDITVLSDVWGDFMNPNDPDYRPELAEVTAVKSGSVYTIAEDILGGVKHVIGVGYMAKWFHSELFEDLDPQAIHQEYLTKFQRLDYDLDEHGVFVFPPT